jgi:hypothetical protein
MSKQLASLMTSLSRPPADPEKYRMFLIEQDNKITQQLGMSPSADERDRLIRKQQDIREKLNHLAKESK